MIWIPFRLVRLNLVAVLQGLPMLTSRNGCGMSANYLWRCAGIKDHTL